MNVHFTSLRNPVKKHLTTYYTASHSWFLIVAYKYVRSSRTIAYEDGASLYICTFCTSCTSVRYETTYNGNCHYEPLHQLIYIICNCR